MRHEIVEFLKANGPHTVLQMHEKLGGDVREIANSAIDLTVDGNLYFEALDMTFWYVVGL